MGGPVNHAFLHPGAPALAVFKITVHKITTFSKLEIRTFGLINLCDLVGNSGPNI